MRIGIDARMYQQSGIGRYIRNLISGLRKQDTQNEYFILLKKSEFNNLNFKKNFTKVLADFSWYGLKEQIKLPSILNNLKVDLVHFPHFNVPILYKGKFVVTIHDLIHQHFTMKRVTTLNPLIYKIKQFGYNKIFKNAILKSEKILVPSVYVKNLLVQQWNIEERKVTVTPEAVDDSLISLKSKVKSKKVLDNLKIKEPYIFYVGNAHPHKNVKGLIKVFLKLKIDYPNLKLVLSGGDHYFWQKIKSEYQQKNIIFTGFISDQEMVGLYKNAKCFVMPSLEEGFGIPLLEAMAVGCPVVSSNAGSLPEVGGDAAIYFNPNDTDDMVDKIFQVLNNEGLRKSLIEKGKKRVKQFSWEKLAKQTLEVYSKCA